MTTRNIIFSILLTIFISVMGIVMIFEPQENISPLSVYQVYLNGNNLGYINNNEELYRLINDEQKEIKETYDVDNVYPPNGLEVVLHVTYGEKISEVNDIYNKIKNEQAFTINGYKITIYKEDKENEVIYVLDEEVFVNAIKEFVSVFVGSNSFELYINDNQLEIKDVGVIIETLYFNETIKIKNENISAKEKIFTDVATLSQYLLYGTNEKQDTYTVEAGETISDVAFKNKLNTEEFLIANPQFNNENNLLSAGQTVNVGLINPLISLTAESHVIEDLDVDFEKKVEYDYSKNVGYTSTKQSGENGKTRVTQKVKTVNGEPYEVIIITKEVLKPAIDEIIVKGGRKQNYNPDGDYNNGYGDTNNWSWPTLRPYIISSPFGWRWGKMHEAVDITGPGNGSPIFAANNGVVEFAGWDRTGGGNTVIINHNNGYYTVYAHLNGIYVRVGQTIVRGSTIGGMGRTGIATGTHLHFGVYIGGYHLTGGRSMNPLVLYR